MTQELISAAQIPNEWMRAAETFLKRRVFAVEADAVRQLSDLYARAYSDLRTIAHATAEGMGITTASSAWREQFEQYARGRIERLAADGLQVAATSASIAYAGGYYGRSYLLDSLTPTNKRINMPALNIAVASDLMQENEYDDLIRSLLGKEWREQYMLELDSLTVEIRRALGAGMQNGEGIPQIMQRVARSMGVSTDRRRGAIGSAERQGYRANFARIQTLTRTSVQSMYTKGSLSAYRANDDILSGTQHLTGRDERVCLICAPLDGRFYPLESNQDLPPLHFNCRCTRIPVVKPEAEREPQETAPETLRQWAQGYGIVRELERFIAGR